MLRTRGVAAGQACAGPQKLPRACHAPRAAVRRRVLVGGPGCRPSRALTCRSTTQGPGEGGAPAESSERAGNSSSYQWCTALETGQDLRAAIKRAVERCKEQAGEDADKLDVALIFCASSYKNQYERVVPMLREYAPNLKTVVGCSGFGVIGAGQEDGRAMELERSPGVSVTLGHIPGASLTAFHVTPNEVPDMDSAPEAWGKAVGVEAEDMQDVSAMVLFGDPTFAAVTDFMTGLDYAFPRATKIGGLSSSGLMSEPRALLCWQAGCAPTGCGINSSPAGESELDEPDDDDAMVPTHNPPHPTATGAGEGAVVDALVSEAHPSPPGPHSHPPEGMSSSFKQKRGWGPGSPVPLFDEYRAFVQEGVVGLAIRGDVHVEPIIAQGCRPLVENTYTITKCNGNVILEIEDQSQERMRPLQALSNALEEVRRSLDSDAELEEMARNINVAVAADPLKPLEALSAGDFLVRAIVGATQTGELGVGDMIKVGQRLRFMVRDRAGALLDLSQHATDYKRRDLEASLRGNPRPPAFGALVFTCNGRGKGLYGAELPSHDARTIQSFVPVGMSGFFANGEIGPVGGATRLHGFTCAAAILRQGRKEVADGPAEGEGPPGEGWAGPCDI
ncbi:unnamed protein product [Pedinophyceae sp. YPF-701]|nr:unnamed protein product [Pedinophyceae sp. YPF-701]